MWESAGSDTGGSSEPDSDHGDGGHRQLWDFPPIAAAAGLLHSVGGSTTCPRCHRPTAYDAQGGGKTLCSSCQHSFQGPNEQRHAFVVCPNCGEWGR